MISHTIHSAGQAAELLVFAHTAEAQAFSDVPHLVTGVGKVNGAVALATELAARQVSGEPVSRVTVLGTAGVLTDAINLDTVLQITAAVQHDFALPSPQLELGEPQLTDTAVIATGDVFVHSDAERQRIRALGATLVDMEVYAYAATCAAFQVPLRVFKIGSDFADDDTSETDWDEIVAYKSRQLREFYDTVMPQLASQPL